MTKKNLTYQMMTDTQKKKLEKELSQLFEKHMQQLISNIAEDIAFSVENQLEKRKPEITGDFYYSENIFGCLKDITASLFVCKTRANTNTVLWEKLYKRYQDENEALYEETKGLMDSQLVDDILWKIRFNKENGIIDEQIKYNLQAMLDYLGGNDITEAPIIEQYDKWWYNCTVGCVYDLLSSLYREAFSDNMACLTLQNTMEEYILSFIYENPHVELSLAPTEDRALRIGAVLERRFNCKCIVNETTGEVEPLPLKPEELKRMYRDMFGQFRGTDEAQLENTITQIIENMNKIWTIYGESDSYMTQLRKYLEKTEEIHGLQEENVPDLNSCMAMRKIYKDARSMNTHEGVMNVIQGLLQVWAGMAM